MNFIKKNLKTNKISKSKRSRIDYYFRHRGSKKLNTSKNSIEKISLSVKSKALLDHCKTITFYFKNNLSLTKNQIKNQILALYQLRILKISKIYDFKRRKLKALIRYADESLPTELQWVKEH